MWRVTEHAWLYVVATRHEGAAGRAGKELFTRIVNDLDDLIAQLAARRLRVQPIEVIAESVRTVAITDPEGNRLTFGQPRS